MSYIKGTWYPRDGVVDPVKLLPIDYSYPSLFFESMSLSLAHPKLPGAGYYLDEYVLSRINNWPVHETVQSHTVFIFCSVL